MIDSANRKVVMSANTAWYLFNFRASTISRLIELGWSVIACSPDSEYSDKLRSLGATVHHVEIGRKSLNPIRELSTISQYFRLYRKIKPSIILNFTPKCNLYSSMAAIFLGIPFINNISGLGFAFRRRGIVAKIVTFLYRITQRFADTVFFQNHDDLQYFVQSGIVPEGIAIRIFGSGVSMKRFSYSPRVDDGKIRCIFLGRLLAEKGILIFAEVARQFANMDERFEFSILGQIDPGSPTGIDLNTVNDWQREGILNYLGMSDYVESVLKNHDVIILPSSYAEGMPKSLLEAAAMGKVVITTDTAGCRETVTESSGYLLRENTAADINRVLTTFANLSVGERYEMGVAARHYAEEKFSDIANIGLYEDAIGRAVRNVD